MSTQPFHEVFGVLGDPQGVIAVVVVDVRPFAVLGQAGKGLPGFEHVPIRIRVQQQHFAEPGPDE